MTLDQQLSLALLDSWGPLKARRAVEAVGGDPTRLLDPDIYHFLPDFPEKVFHELHSPTHREKVQKELDFIGKNQVRCLWFKGPDYPLRLNTCPDAPLMLYQMGNTQLDVRKVVSIVGTRSMSDYGRRLCGRLVEGLAEAFPDTLIVSGLAFGADICAHRNALKHGLPTVGVVAHGLNRLYPPQHRSTMVEMLKNGGGLLSEFGRGIAPLPARFVQRNRLIAGLCDACVVVESKESGGSLITARMARDYNREVFTFPGSCEMETSRGCHRLIKQQIASLIEDVEDLLEGMNWAHTPRIPVEKELFGPSDPRQRALLDCMDDARLYAPGDLLLLAAEAKGPEKISSIGEVLSLLLLLEMDGHVLSLPGGLYRKA